jgi:hypothetical protein
VSKIIDLPRKVTPLGAPYDTTAQEIVENIQQLFTGHYLPLLADYCRVNSTNMDGRAHLCFYAPLFGTLCADGDGCTPYFRTYFRDRESCAIMVLSLVSHLDIFLYGVAHQSSDLEIPTAITATALRTLLVHGAPLSIKFGGTGRSPLIEEDRQYVVSLLQKATRGPRYPDLPGDLKETLLELWTLLQDSGPLPRWRGRYDGRDGSHRQCDRVGCQVTQTKGVCGRCQCSRYCSRACQRLDWKALHKRRCVYTNWRSLE